MSHTKHIDYQDGDTTLEAYVAYPQLSGKHPAVMVCHDWSGKNPFAKQKADYLASLGYVGFALDMYGKGKLGQTKPEKNALMQPLVSDRTMLQNRLLVALKVLRELDSVDPTKIAAIGFCFGGLCALDLARSGADVKGVVSFHGLLNPANTPNHVIRAKVLVLHGHDDPSARPEAVAHFIDEMTEAKADWQINIYGNTQHAFTNPAANDPVDGLIYNPQTNARAFAALEVFLKEIFV